MKKAAQNWFDSASYDLRTAQTLFVSGRYLYVVFMCHLAIEKMLKAVVAERTGQMPPKTHSLMRLADLTKVELPDDHAPIIKHLDGASVPIRYPSDLKELQRTYTRKATAAILQQTRDLLRWLKKTLSPKP